MPQKVDGKFYPLKEEEWTAVWQELKPADIHLLYFLRSIDPYSNGVELSISEVAKKLNRSKSTVCTSLKALKSKGYISLEVTHVRVKLEGKGVFSTANDDSLQRTGILCSEQAFSTANNDSLQRTGILCSEQAQPETPLQQPSQTPKINKTYSNFKKILSEEDREKFESFVSKEYGKPIKNFSAFMSGEHFDYWWDRYTCAIYTVDWASYPKIEEWKKQATEMPVWFIHEGDKDLTKDERIALVDWLKSQQQEVA